MRPPAPAGASSLVVTAVRSSGRGAMEAESSSLQRMGMLMPTRSLGGPVARRRQTLTGSGRLVRGVANSRQRSRAGELLFSKYLAKVQEA